MSGLRLLGLAVGLVIAAWAFHRFRRGQLRRLDVTMIFALGGGLVLVSVYPDAVNTLLGILAMKREHYSRLIVLLVISALLLWLAVLYLNTKHAWQDQQMDRLLRALGKEDFLRRYGDTQIVQPITVVIPAYIEADSIRSVLERIPRDVQGIPVGTLVVVDGADDSTTQAVMGAGVPYARNLINRGGGAALRLGYDIALVCGARVIVTMDADGQHRPEEIPDLVEPALSDRWDVVLGSRLLGTWERESRMRVWGLYLFNGLIRFLTGVRITDCSNGFRAFRADALGRLRLRQNQYHTSEYIIEAAKKGLRIGEVPVTVLRRQTGQSKKGRDWLYGLHFARTIVRSWWRSP